MASWVDPLGYFSVAELKALDTQFELRGPVPVSSPIIIVSVDDEEPTRSEASPSP